MPETSSQHVARTGHTVKHVVAGPAQCLTCDWPDLEPTCALWILDYNTADYLLCDTEDDAISEAISNQMSDHPWTILGLQHADGRLIPHREWTAYHLAERAFLDEERHRNAERRAAEAANPTPPKPRVRVPFPDGTRTRTAAIEPGDPTWLGAGTLDPCSPPEKPAPSSASETPESACSSTEATSTQPNQEPTHSASERPTSGTSTSPDAPPPR